MKLIEALRRAQNDSSIGLAFLPDVIKAHGPKALREIERLADSGVIELRPEGGIGRLSPQELSMTLPGPQGTRLSWARVIDSANVAALPRPRAKTKAKPRVRRGIQTAKELELALVLRRHGKPAVKRFRLL